MRILIADDHGIMREGLRALIEKQSDMEVVGEAEDGQMVVELAKKFSPDVIIMDITMPNLNGVEATREILAQIPSARIIALSMHSNKRFVAEMLKAGAVGYVLKSYLFDELVRAIHSVSANAYYLSPQITDVLIEDYIGQPVTSGEPVSSRLTERERRMLQLLSEGQSTKQIALRLGISPKTADANRRQIMSKLGIYSVAELTKYAIREGLTSLEF
ncbi:MAG: response regulator [Planctomycetota bacterium]|jgi:DNA-binding NarL/FixJ family response regulator